MIVSLIIISVILMFFLIFLWLVAPNKRRQLPAETMYAHRGFWDDSLSVPENSLAAFARAKNAGYPVELDVQLTRDGKLVVFHDNTLKRMCGDPRRISELTYDELFTFRLKGTSERIPLFSDVLAVLDGNTVICEIKVQGSNKNTKACEYVCKYIDGYRGKIIIESFSPYIVGWFKKNRPDIIRGQLSANFGKSKSLRGIPAFMMTNLLVNRISRPDFIAYNLEHDSLGFLICRTFFDPLLVAWTLRDDRQLAACKSKYQSIIFEKNIQPGRKDRKNGNS